MSTRGLIGIVYNGKEFLSYNHSDSYPTYLGLAFMRAIRASTPQGLQAYAETLVLVDSEKSPVKKDLSRMKVLGLVELLDKSSRKGPTALKPTWYDVLREYQGDLDAAIKSGLPWWVDDAGFQYSSSCEWCYVVNLDKKCLEIYTGHYASPSYPKVPPKGRYVEAVKSNPSLTEKPSNVVTLIDEIGLGELYAVPEYALDSYCQRLDRKF